MPELPEVETIRRDLEKYVIGRKIINITTNAPKQVQPSLEKVKEAVVGATIAKLGRRAKVIQLHLDNGRILIVHLKMTGRLLFRKKDEPADLWQHVVFDFEDGHQLRFADARKFGWIRLIGSQDELNKIVAEYGPEPFDDLTLEKFKAVLKKFGRPVKVVIMDQSQVSGVGNIYASDALFLAKIDPRRLAKSLSEAEAERLYKGIEEVLTRGLTYRGASDQYYVDAKGEKGGYQDHFLVYGKKGEPCPEGCAGTIERIVLGGRSTFFCPSCQK